MSQDEKNKTKKEELEDKEASKEVVEADEVSEETAEDEKVGEKTPELEDTQNSKDIEDAENVEEETIEENISEELEGVEEVKKDEERIPDFRVGDTIRVSYKIIEGDKVRTQPYQGIVIAKKGSDVSKTFTVRKIGADGVGVERIFPFLSPNIEKVNVIKRGKVRRAKLYYLRDRVGRKATKIKEKVVQPVK